MATTPVFLPEESHGQRSLAGYSPCGHKGSDATEATEQACMWGIGSMDYWTFKFLIGKIN